jgi:GNAT superfamily N-acetyltransferase
VMRDEERAGPEITIRPPSDRDLDALGELMGQLGYPAGADSMQRRLASFGDDPRTIVLVAESESEPVGVAMAHLSPAIHLDQPVAMLIALVVADGSRSRGVGRQLVAAVEDWAKRSGARRMSVTTNVARHRAHAFYERLGYENTGRRYLKLLG